MSQGGYQLLGVPNAETSTGAQAKADAAQAAAITTARKSLRPGLPHFRGLAPATARTAGPASSLASSASVLGGTNRLFVPVVDTTQQVFYPIFTNSFGSQDAPGTTAITVGCALESGATIVPLSFAGAAKITLQPGQWAIPDTPPTIPLVSVSYASGSGSGTVTGFWMRTYVQIASGGYPVSAGLSSVLVTGEINGESSTGGTDLTLAGSSSVTTGNSPYAFGFGPQMILSRTKSHRVIAALGDSIVNGQGDAPNSYGWIDRAAIATATPILKIGRSGSAVVDWNTSGSRRTRGTQLDGVTDVIVAWGINDLVNNARTAAQLKADLTTLYAYLAGLGIRVHAATLCPRTTSTDSFATTTNQTAASPMTTAILADVNDWIRLLQPNVYGVIEQADAVMSARNSGLWKVDGTANKYTSDGTHPNNAGHTLTAAVLTSYVNAYKASSDW